MDGELLDETDVVVPQFENSELLPSGSVAVAVITWPPDIVTGKTALKLASQLLPVVTWVEPMNV